MLGSPAAGVWASAGLTAAIVLWVPGFTESSTLLTLMSAPNGMARPTENGARAVASPLSASGLCSCTAPPDQLSLAQLPLVASVRPMLVRKNERVPEPACGNSAVYRQAALPAADAYRSCSACVVS